MALLRTARRAGRAAVAVLAPVLLAVALTACSSSGPAEQTAAPSVTDNGKRYSYDPGTVPQSRWPNPCTLLTNASAATALGTTVTAKRFHMNCFFIPSANTFPDLTITILGIGSGHSAGFSAVRTRNARYKPVAVPGVATRAVIYTLPGSPSTTRLDVLADQGLFEVALRIPAGSSLQQTTAAATLTQVGKALGREFAG